MKQTKIVASISDRRCSQDFIRKLFFAGMNVVRMNTAHATPDGIREIVRNVRAVSSHIALMIWHPPLPPGRDAPAPAGTQSSAHRSR